MNPCCKCRRHRHQQSGSDDVMRKVSGFESKTEFWGLSEPGELFSRLTSTWALTAAWEPRTWLHSSRFFSTASERPCTFRIPCQNLGTFFKAISDVTLPENLPPNSLLFSQKVAFSLSMFSWGLVSASLILLLPPVSYDCMSHLPFQLMNFIQAGTISCSPFCSLPWTKSSMIPDKCLLIALARVPRWLMGESGEATSSDGHFNCSCHQTHSLLVQGYLIPGLDPSRLWRN